MNDTAIGRPSKFRPEFIDQARKLCMIGSTDVQMADFFGVVISTFYAWKNDYPELSEVLKSSKHEFDNQVVKSLMHRALGYTHPEDKIFCNKDGATTTVATVKHYAPDTTACIFWLKNRQPDTWKDRHQQEISNPDGSLQNTDTTTVVTKLNSILANARLAKQQAETPKEISPEDESEFI